MNIALVPAVRPGMLQATGHSSSIKCLVRSRAVTRSQACTVLTTGLHKYYLFELIQQLLEVLSFIATLFIYLYLYF